MITELWGVLENAAIVAGVALLALSTLVPHLLDFDPDRSRRHAANTRGGQR